MANKVQHTINGVDFSDIKTSNKSFQPLIHNNIGGFTTNDLNEDYGVGGDLPKLINAVEIDWNGADFAGMTVPASAPTSINTTEDLLKTIKYAANGERFGKLMFAESLREPHSSQRLAKRYEKV